MGGQSIEIWADHKTMIIFTVGLLSSHQTIFLNFHVHKNGRTALITSVRSMNRDVHVQESKYPGTDEGQARRVRVSRIFQLSCS